MKGLQGGVLAALGFAQLNACTDPSSDALPAPGHIPQEPTEPRVVHGTIIDRAGQPIASVLVQSREFIADPLTRETVTDASGQFSLEGLRDVNTLLQIEAAGYYSEVVPVFLQGFDESVQLEPLALVAKRSGGLRLWLAGDTMFARRFEDKDEDGDKSEPSDLIRPLRRAEDTYRLFRYLQPAMASADYRVVNFESPASLAHESRHPYKEFSFSSHPETLSALPRAGIDAVSLGNNHSYDYLEPGRLETEYALRRRGIAFFGSGGSETEARASLLEVSVNGVPLSFQGFDGIKPANFYPDPNVPWATEYLYYAMDQPRKGGALLLSQDNIADFMRTKPERLRIPVMHGGEEYGETPTDSMRDRFEQAHQAGAKVVVAHHSHTVYGISLWGDTDNPSLTFLSLGNFIFDQDVFETFNSFMAVLDLDAVGAGDYRLLQLRLIPFHQENYVPSLISGRQAELLARRVGHISTHLPERSEDALRPAVMFKDAAGIGVMLRPTDYREETLNAERQLTVANGESEIFPLNLGRGASDYLASYATPGVDTRLRLARDLLIFGDFEDYDLDDTTGENDHWWQTQTRYATLDQAKSGRHSLVLYRAQGAQSQVNTQLRNRVTFTDGADLTLGCHFMGVNAGEVRVVAQYIQRDTRRQVGEETLLTRAAGSYAWTDWHASLAPPEGAGHVRFVITLDPSGNGGALYIDDCTLLEWGPSLSPAQALPTPHAYEWGRLEVPEAAAGALLYTEERRVYHRVYGAQ